MNSPQSAVSFIRKKPRPSGNRFSAVMCRGELRTVGVCARSGAQLREGTKESKNRYSPRGSPKGGPMGNEYIIITNCEDSSSGTVKNAWLWQATLVRWARI